MKTRLEKATGATVLVLPDRVVRDRASELTRDIRTLVGQGSRRIVIDMAQCELLDSAALGALIHARRENSSADVDMTIRNARGYVLGLLENTRMNALFRMENGGTA